MVASWVPTMHHAGLRTYFLSDRRSGWELYLHGTAFTVTFALNFATDDGRRFHVMKTHVRYERLVGLYNLWTDSGRDIDFRQLWSTFFDL